MPKSAVIVQHSSNYGGSTLSGQLVALALADLGWHVHVVFAFQGPFVDIFCNEGFPVRVIEHKSWLRTNHPIRFIRQLHTEEKAANRFVEFFESVQPNLVYINTLVSLAPAIAAKRMSIPTLWHIRELFSNVGGEMKCPGRIGRTYVRRTVRRLARQVVVISKAVGENILGRAQVTQAEVVHNAVASKFFETRKEETPYRRALGLPEHVPIVGVPGTLRPMKGHLFFLKSVPEILLAEPSCHFAITGDGTSSYKAQVIDLARSLGILPCVHFLGTVKCMEKFYHACDVVCIPSASEPFGRTVIEAFASRVPVVATSVGGIVETIRDGENGLLVGYEHASELAQKIVRLLRDPHLRNRFAEKAHEDAVKYFHEQQYRQRIGQIARRCLAA